MRKTDLKSLSAAATTVALAAASTVHAASATWTGATDGNWTVGTNWSASPIPGTPGGATGDTATFSNATNTSISLAGSQRSLNSLLFSSTSLGSFTFSASGSEGFTLANNGNIRIESSVTQAVTQTFNTPISLAGNYTFQNSSTNVSSTLLFRAPVVSTNGAASTLTLNAVAPIVVASTISEGPGAGALSLTKSSTGSAFLLGSNTFTGPAGFAASGNHGTIVFNSIGNVGSGASSLGNPGSVSAGTIAMPHQGTSPSGTLRYIGGGHTTDRVIQTGNGSGLTSTNSVAVLDASGSGALVWNGNVSAVSFSGTDTNARTFRLFGSSTADNTFAGTIPNSSASTTALQKLGVGTWALTGSNSFTGGIAVSEGRLTLDYSTATSVVNSANAVNIGQTVASGASGGTLAFKAKSTGATSQGIGAVTFTNSGSNSTNMSTGASRIVLDPNGGSSLAVTAASITRHVSNDLGATAYFELPASSSLASTALIAQTGGIAGWGVVKDASGTGFLTQASAGANVSRYTGATALTAGFGTTTATTFSTSGNLTLTGANRNLGALHVDTTGGGTLNLGGLTITAANANGRAVLFTGSGDYAINNGVLSASTNELLLHQYSTGLVTLGATTGFSTGQITKAGPGTLAMGSRGSTGALYITDGALRANDPTVISAGRIVIGGGGVLELTSSSGNFTGAFGTGAGQIKITGSGGFSAFGSNRSALISGGDIAWAAANFVGNNSALVLSSASSDATIDFQNGLGFGNAQRVVDVRNGTAAKDAVLSGALTGGFGGGLIKRGAGTLEVTGNSNTYQGDTWIEAGTLLVNNTSGSGTGTGAVTAFGNATLGGSGSIAGSVNVRSSATLAPGNSPGVLAVGGDVTLTSGSVFEVELQGTTAGTQYDQLQLTGSAGTINLGNATLSTSFSTFTPTGGDVLFVINNLNASRSIAGIFAGLADNALVTSYGGFDWYVTYNADAQGNALDGGNDVALYTVVPEPAALSLLTVVAGGLLRRRRLS